MNEIEALNRNLFLQINGGNDTPSWLVQTAIGMADYLVYLIPVLFAAQWLWGGQDRRRLTVKACLVTLLALGANQVIGLFWMHPRPFMLGLGRAWLAHATDSSFPSDHATVFASVGLAMLFGGATRLATGILVTGALVAWARVFLGVHFPLDMAGSVAVSAVAYGVVSPLWRVAGEPLVQQFEWLYHTLLAWPIHAGWVRH